MTASSGRTGVKLLLNFRALAELCRQDGVGSAATARRFLEGGDSHAQRYLSGWPCGHRSCRPLSRRSWV